MSPVTSEPLDAEFVVVGRLQALCHVQENMVDELKVIKSRLGSMGIRLAAVERAAEVNVHMRAVMLSFAAAATPVILSVLVDLNLPEHHTPTVDFVRAISKLLLAFAACVGVPLLMQALTDLRDVKIYSPQRLREDTTTITPSGDDGGNYATTDGEESEDDKAEEDEGEATEE